LTSACHKWHISDTLCQELAMPATGPITTIRENCRKCYACVRNCPVKAIRVCRDHAEVIAERCIG